MVFSSIFRKDTPASKAVRGIATAKPLLAPPF